MHGWDALYIFMLAAFTGYEVIGRVPVILHTPLMSGSNFVHGIVVVGSMVALGAADTNAQRTVGFIGVLLGAANAVGGYAVTDRMLEMFRSSRDLRSGGKDGPGGRPGEKVAAGDGPPAAGDHREAESGASAGARSSGASNPSATVAGQFPGREDESGD